MWLAGAAPELFALLRRHDQARQHYLELSTGLAEWVGIELVAHPGLSVAQRRQVLSVRRRLYNGAQLPAADCTELAVLAERLCLDPDLPAALRQAGACAARLDALADQAAKAVAAVHQRLLPLPWRLLNDHPAGRHALADGTLPPANDIRRRLAGGQAWTSGVARSRQHCHIGPAGGPRAGSPPLAGWYATETVENLQARRHGLAASGRLTGETRLAIAPLRWTEAEHWRILAVDPANPAELRELTLRQSGLLPAMATALGGGGPGTR